MSFLTISFVIFVVVLLTAYYTVLKNKQWLLLLCGSLVFYCYASPYYLIFVLISIGSAYAAGCALSRIDSAIDNLDGLSKDEKKQLKKKAESRKKVVLALTLIFNVGILVVLKYTGFFMENIVALINAFGGKISVPRINLILPLGISYYTFMTVGYLCDVYWGITKAETNFYKYALFILYFPHITQGPIDAYADMKDNLYSKHTFSGDNIQSGLYRILVGLFKKLVIASRLAVYVDAVYGAPESYEALTLLCATFFYAIQMYCDFSGYMDMAVGISQLFGIKIAENFDLPYFSRTIPEYWRRWHITLGAWFRTYIYFPVIRSSMCKNLSKRIKKNHDKAVASMVTTIIGLACVWLLTGLWHGASWHYIMHGVYHGVIIISSTILAGLYQRLKNTLHISEESRVFHVFQIVRTFVLVDISYILFRASNLSDAVYIIKKIISQMSVNGAALKASILPFTEDNTAVAYGAVAFVAVFMLFIVECARYNGKDFTKKYRPLVVGVMVLMTALFGVFGQSTFLYAAY